MAFDEFASAILLVRLRDRLMSAVPWLNRAHHVRGATHRKLLVHDGCQALMIFWNCHGDVRDCH